MAILIIVVTLVIIGGIGFLVLFGSVFESSKSINNPNKKDNSDYRFIEVFNEKTRNIFEQEKK